MKQTMRKIITAALLIFILGISTASFAVAETTVNYTVDPEEPTPLSDVTITVEIDDETITSVYLEMQECNIAGTCFGWDTRILMTPTGEANKYETQITLEHEDAKYFSLRLAIERDGEWEYISQENYHDVYLDRSGIGNGNDNDSKSPGFEMILLLAAVSVGIILFKRKRLQ